MRITGICGIAVAAMVTVAADGGAASAQALHITKIGAARNMEQYVTSCVKGCVVILRNSPGGYIDDFLKAARMVEARADRVVIDGSCRSACALFADRARPNVCITKNAEFKFHSPRKEKILVATDTFMITLSTPVRGWKNQIKVLPQSADILRWVKAHGGFPIDGLLSMNAREAAKFWPSCELEYR